jgi:hypothetical protein
MRMSMIVGLTMTVKMHMPHPVMIMVMEMPPLSDQLQTEQPPEHHQHKSHDSFRGDRKRFGNGHSEHEHDRANDEQHDGMTDAPAQTDETGRTPGGSLGQHGRNGGKMVCVECVTQAQDKAQSKNR